MNRDDRETAEQEFSERLLALDEALAAGAPLDAYPTPPISSALATRFQRSQACLLRLERARLGAASVTPPSFHEPSPPPDDRQDSTGSVRRLGRFQIVRELGRGGFGIVFLAFDPRLHREVALKVPHLEAFLTPELRQRFKGEFRAAAGLDHPGLVPVYEAEADAEGGLCYIVSAYCAGPTLAAWLAAQREPMPVRMAAALVADLAEAVAYMHGRGILHRDIKPSNVLLAPKALAAKTDGPPADLDFTPRLTDFGLAKVLDASGSDTLSGDVLGTPAYMAPEQALGARDKIGPAADVYALGAALYELLTGTAPFAGPTKLDVLRQVQHAEPRRPRTLRPILPRDLETICLTCLEKEPHRRYADAAALAADLRRYLDGKPIAARGAVIWSRAWKWARRKSRIIAIVGAAIAGVLAFQIASAWNADEPQADDADILAQFALQQEQNAEAERKARVRDRDHYCRVIPYAEAAIARGDPTAKDILAEARPTPGQVDMRGFEWHYLWRLCHRERFTLGDGKRPFNSVRLSPDDTLLASGGEDGLVRLWDPVAGNEVATLRGHTIPVFFVSFSPKGDMLASAASGITPEKGEVKLWDVKTRKCRKDLPGHVGPVNCVAFSADGKTLGSAGLVGKSASGIILWDVSTGAKKATKTLRHGVCHVTSIAFSHDGKTIATAASDGIVELWDASSLKKLGERQGPGESVWSLSFSNSDQMVSGAGWDGHVWIWWIDLPGAVVQARKHAGRVWSLATSHDGGLVASGGWDATVQLWIADMKPIETLIGHRGPIPSVTVSGDGKTIASASHDGTIKIWDYPHRSNPQVLSGHKSEVWTVAFSPDGKTLASGADDHTVKLWDAATGALKATLEARHSLVVCLAFSPDGTRLASGDFDGYLKVWDLSKKEARVIASSQLHKTFLNCLAFSPNGKLLATGSRDRIVALWNVEEGHKIDALTGHAGTVQAVAFTNGGKTLISTDHTGLVRSWDVVSGTRHADFRCQGDVCFSAFSPDRRTFVWSNSRGGVCFRDLKTGRTSEMKGHAGRAFGLAFTPDGRTLASAGNDGSICLWNVAARKLLLQLKGNSQQVSSVAFSPDGRTLASACHDHTIKLWHAATEEEVARKAAILPE